MIWLNFIAKHKQWSILLRNLNLPNLGFHVLPRGPSICLEEAVIEPTIWWFFSGSRCTSARAISGGVPQGCVLASVHFSLSTHNWVLLCKPHTSWTKSAWTSTFRFTPQGAVHKNTQKKNCHRESCFPTMSLWRTLTSFHCQRKKPQSNTESLHVRGLPLHCMPSSIYAKHTADPHA